MAFHIVLTALFAAANIHAIREDEESSPVRGALKVAKVFVNNAAGSLIDAELIDPVGLATEEEARAAAVEESDDNVQAEEYSQDGELPNVQNQRQENHYADSSRASQNGLKKQEERERSTKAAEKTIQGNLREFEKADELIEQEEANHNTKANTDYVVTEIDAIGCPSGFAQIANSSACSTASSQLRFSFQSEIDREDIQPGCVKYIDGRVWFNTDNDGQSLNYASICAKEANADYVVTEIDAVGCPSGFAQIANSSACSLAASQLRLSYQSEIDREDIQPGCVKYIEGGVWFNTNNDGQSLNYAYICVKAPIPTLAQVPEQELPEGVTMGEYVFVYKKGRRAKVMSTIMQGMIKVQYDNGNTSHVKPDELQPFPGLKVPKATYDAMDIDGDGDISQEELEAYKARKEMAAAKIKAATKEDSLDKISKGKDDFLSLAKPASQNVEDSEDEDRAVDGTTESEGDDDEDKEDTTKSKQDTAESKKNITESKEEIEKSTTDSKKEKSADQSVDANKKEKPTQPNGGRSCAGATLNVIVLLYGGILATKVP